MVLVCWQEDWPDWSFGGTGEFGALWTDWLILFWRHLVGRTLLHDSGPVLGVGRRIWVGLQGTRKALGTRGLTGGWSRELERCTTAPLLVESLKLNVEAERDIWGGHMEQPETKMETDMRKVSAHQHKEPNQEFNPRTAPP